MAWLGSGYCQGNVKPMRRARELFLSGVVCLAAFVSVAHAGTWSASQHTALPGDLITLDLRFTGEGLTTGTDVRYRLDTTRLTIEAPAGHLTDADRAGLCGWDGWGSVAAVYFNLGGGCLKAIP